MSDYLIHYGVKGMKWGVRKERSYGEQIQRAEKKAIKKQYKKYRKQGGHSLFRSARISTGENYENAVKNYENLVRNDSKYKDLSKKAFDAERRRLLLEKPASDKSGILDDDKYERIINSKKYQDALKASKSAARAKKRRLEKLSSDYVDTIKNAKLDDLKIEGKERDIAKQYISSRFYDFYWDGNLDYNPDNYYEDWVDTARFK